LKSEQDALDLVIVAAEWGEGKRANVLSSFTLACIDEDGNFLEIGRVGTGIKEKESIEEDDESVTFQQLTDELKPLVVSEKGRDVVVKPKVVVEVVYEEIQKSPTYTSGYALRFPRLKRLRTADRSAEDITTIDAIEDLYYSQKK